LAQNVETVNKLNQNFFEDSQVKAAEQARAGSAQQKKLK
jgi:hypothetical protein